MIGEQKEGRIDGVIISAASHEVLQVTVNGRPARLAVVDEEGNIIAAGLDVAREAKAVAVNSYRKFLKGEGFLKVLSKPIPTT